MKKFLIAGSGLAAVAAAGSAGAVDVTLGGSIEMGIEYGLGKDADGFAFDGSKAYQDIVLNISAAGTTDAGLKFGGSFSVNSAEEMKLNLYDTNGTAAGGKNLVKLVNTSASAAIKGVAYNVSGGKQVLAGSMVSVKINSAWQGAKTKLTDHTVPVGTIAVDSAICKVAGVIEGGAAGSVTRMNAAGTAAVSSLALAVGAMPAGKMNDSAAATLTMATAGGGANVAVAAAASAGAVKPVVASAAATPIQANSVCAGPFMEVKMTSSTTKMVVGAVCVSNDVEASETAAYLDPASRILEVSNASIFLEGGFGKLTLQQGDYSGKVAAIGSAGDQATITSTGLVAILEGASFMGMSGYGAVDVGSISMGSRPNYMLGTSVDLMGLTVAVEMEDDQATVGADSDNHYIDNWDMGTSYAIGDLALDFVLDSAGDWAVSASASVAGFTASSVIENISKGASKKSGLSIDTTLATDFNGISVSIGLDEAMNYTVGGSYALGNSGLAITASYSSEDNGGKIAGKMSF